LSWLKRIFQKDKELDAISLGSLKTDIHSHLIPGVDDGAKRMENSIRLIQDLAEFGYKNFITTPHIMSDLYPNEKSDLIQKADDLREELDKENIDVTLQISAEYYLDQHFMKLIAKNDLMPFGDNFILFEMGFIEKSPLLQECVFELQSAGYKPILAHPERYSYMHKSIDQYESLCDQGVYLQLNINSVTGHYGPLVLKTSEELVSKDMISVLGTDCHHLGHIELMEKAVKSPIIHHLVESGKLMNKEFV